MSELIDYIAGNLGITNKSMLEKDLLLHKILAKLSRTSFGEEFLFKGGTCITKCYLGYYRFSEDLDFTYKKQAEFGGISQKEVRRKLSKKINEVGKTLELVAGEIGLSFKTDKSSREFIEIGGSNKLVTYKLWYISAITNSKQFIKIQINFVEKIFYKPIINKAETLWSGMGKKELMVLFPKEKDLLENATVECYDLKEILIEKVRAILTRRGIKSRDFIDVYLIAKKIELAPEEFEEQIIEKTRFMLQYDKYLQNLEGFSIEEFVLGEEERLLLKPLDNGFKSFLPQFTQYLRNLPGKLTKT